MMFGIVAKECHIATFDPKTGQAIQDIKLETEKAAMPGMGNRSFLTPDGRFLAALNVEQPGGSRFGMPGLGGGGAPKQAYKLRFTDAATGRKLWEQPVESASMMAPPTFRVSPVGNVLAFTTYEKKQPLINLHDTASGRKLATLDSGDREISTINFSADGRVMATTYSSTGTPGKGKPVAGAADTIVTLWDGATGRLLRTLPHTAPVTGVSFNPAGTLLATLGRDNEYLWDVQSGQRLLTLVNLDVLNESGPANEWLAVTPDGLFDE